MTFKMTFNVLVKWFIVHIVEGGQHWNDHNVYCVLSECVLIYSFCFPNILDD